MIKLTRLNGQEVFINFDVIKYVEAIPDTKITFLSNDILLVKESVEEIAKKVFEYKRRVLTGEAFKDG